MEKPDNNPIKRLEQEANFTSKALEATHRLIRDFRDERLMPPKLAPLLLGSLEIAMDELSAPQLTRGVVIAAYLDAVRQTVRVFPAPEHDKELFLQDFEPAFERRMSEI